LPKSGRTFAGFRRYPGMIARPLLRFVMRKHIEDAGFAAPSGRMLGQERRTVAVAQLLATLGLALSTIVAVTVVSVGIARANVASAVIDNEGGLFAVTLLLGVLFIGLGGLTLLHLPHRRRPRH
jgi:hypothetical protein